MALQEIKWFNERSYECLLRVGATVRTHGLSGTSCDVRTRDAWWVVGCEIEIVSNHPPWSLRWTTPHVANRSECARNHRFQRSWMLTSLTTWAKLTFSSLNRGRFQESIQIYRVLLPSLAVRCPSLLNLARWYIQSSVLNTLLIK